MLNGVGVPKMFYEHPYAPAGRVICGDFVSWAEGVQGREAYRLAIGDPPYNIGVQYDGHNDSMTAEEYERFTWNWINAAADLLLPGGILVVAVPDQVAIHAAYLMKYVNKMEFVDWPIWTFRFGQCITSKFITSKLHLLAFRKPGAEHVWNPQDILVPSDRAAKYGDSRTTESATPGMRVPLDVWGSDISSLDGEMLEGDGAYWGRVTGTHSNSERRPLHANQLPELLIARIIKAWSNPNDWVLSTFGGSGTDVVVARALGRHCTTVEQSEQYCASIVDRIHKGAVRI